LAVFFIRRILFFSAAAGVVIFVVLRARRKESIVTYSWGGAVGGVILGVIVGLAGKSSASVLALAGGSGLLGALVAAVFAFIRGSEMRRG
jgi:uncharacterized membrane protein YccC